MRVTQQVNALADRLGRHPATIFRWLKLGYIDIDSEESVQNFLQAKKRRRNPHPIPQPGTETAHPAADHPEPQPDLNQMELGPVGKRGAASALARLEALEERSFARLQRAIEAGNPFQIRECQTFYLRTSEVLRRCDLAVEMVRRSVDEQGVPRRQVSDVALQIGSWFAGSFTQFLSIESPELMTKTDLGSFKHSAIEGFRGILHREVKTALRINPIPAWAAAKVIEAWNVPNL